MDTLCALRGTSSCSLLSLSLSLSLSCKQPLKSPEAGSRLKMLLEKTRADIRLASSTFHDTKREDDHWFPPLGNRGPLWTAASAHAKRSTQHRAGEQPASPWTPLPVRECVDCRGAIRLAACSPCAAGGMCQQSQPDQWRCANGPTCHLTSACGGCYGVPLPLGQICHWWPRLKLSTRCSGRNRTRLSALVKAAGFLDRALQL